MKKDELEKIFITRKKMSQKELKKLRLELMSKDPHCYYCGGEIKEYILEIGDRAPQDMATLDHLHDRFDPKRYQNNDEPVVLCCFRCNNIKSNKVRRDLPKSYWRARAQLGLKRPKDMPRTLYYLELNKKYLKEWS